MRFARRRILARVLVIVAIVVVGAALVRVAATYWAKERDARTYVFVWFTMRSPEGETREVIDMSPSTVAMFGGVTSPGLGRLLGDVEALKASGWAEVGYDSVMVSERFGPVRVWPLRRIDRSVSVESIQRFVASEGSSYPDVEAAPNERTWSVLRSVTSERAVPGSAIARPGAPVSILEPSLVVAAGVRLGAALGALACVAACVWLGLRWRREARSGARRCGACGYEIESLDVCPECGEARAAGEARRERA